MIPKSVEFTEENLLKIQDRKYGLCWLHFAIQGQVFPSRNPDWRKKEEAKRKQEEAIWGTEEDEEILLDATRRSEIVELD